MLVCFKCNDLMDPEAEHTILLSKCKECAQKDRDNNTRGFTIPFYMVAYWALSFMDRKLEPWEHTISGISSEGWKRGKVEYTPPKRIKPNEPRLEGIDPDEFNKLFIERLDVAEGLARKQRA